MKKLSLILLFAVSLMYACEPCGSRFGSGNSEAYFENHGYHECSDVEIIDFDMMNGVIEAKIKNHSSKERRGYLLAGFIDSFSHRIGWACGCARFSLDGKEKDYLKARLEAQPIFARRYTAKLYCK